MRRDLHRRDLSGSAIVSANCTSLKKSTYRYNFLCPDVHDRDLRHIAGDTQQRISILSL
jgi:hypothetical protein